MQRIARALGSTSAAVGVFELALRHGAPVALKDIGMPAEGLDHAADLAVQNPYPNPRPLERAAIRELLQRAFDGAPPS
jgi:maleylacetate reductase